MLEVFCEFRLEAAHQLPNLPPSHKCHRLHGHSYRILLRLEGRCQPDTGWIVDYAEVDRVWNELVHAKLDHQVLNEVLQAANTTSENLAAWMADTLRGPIEILGATLTMVEIWETSRFGARWTR